MWGIKTEYKHKWQCGAVVDVVSRRNLRLISFKTEYNQYHQYARLNFDSQYFPENVNLNLEVCCG